MIIFLLALIAFTQFFYTKYLIGIERIYPAIILAFVVTFIYYLIKYEIERPKKKPNGHFIYNPNDTKKDD